MPQFNAPATWAAAVPAHPLVGKNECATAAEEAARMAFARGVFREGLTPKVSGAGARQGGGYQHWP